MFRVFVETARTSERFLSFLARIDKSRQILLRGGFVSVGMLVLVCGFVVRIVCSINRSRLHGVVFFGLAWFKH